MKMCTQAGSALYVSVERSVLWKLCIGVVMKGSALPSRPPEVVHAMLGGPIDSGTFKPYACQA